MAFFPQQPFYNPPIPFTGSIQGRLQEGKSIIISGRVLPGANRFHVNLQYGSASGTDVALHFNPRYDSSPGYVVTNTYQKFSGWGQEERKHPTPLTQGSAFSLMILVGSDSYKIATNGSHFMEYRHRIPYNAVDTIHVEGMVEISSIAFQSPGPYMPQPQPPYNPQYAVPTPGYPPAQCPFPCPSYPPAPAPCPPAVAHSLPYRTAINGGLYPGKTVTVEGVVNNSAKRMNFDLCFRGSSIALHYNPRFDERVVVRNSHIHDKWGTEERGSGMPFHLGHKFVLTMVCTPQGYNIMVNGNQVHTYKHRHTSLHEINELKINGDLKLVSVMV
ncbi:hypothetical protein ACEWY4_007873 [Coilia grayii]|uniref:Galectin n=1 Tax=Coilia grayii TaxID=363190 RepID=A0ABD1K9A4_9TELE